MIQEIKVHYLEINPSAIINLDQPCHYEAFHKLAGYTDRCIPSFCQEVNDAYYREMDRRTGHWSRLLESVARWGIQYPIVVTTGVPKIRDPGIVPREYQYTDSKYWIVCESQGGSRILAAQKLGIKVPALINDHVGLFDNLQPIRVRDLANYGVGVDEIFISAAYGVQIRQYPRTHLNIEDTEYLKQRKKSIAHVIERHLMPQSINMEKRITHGSTND